MKTTSTFNLNDYWTVTLTKTGADALNALHRQYSKEHPNLAVFKTLRTDYVEGETYKQQGWSMMKIFGNSCGLGYESPFLNCQVQVESDSSY